MSHWEWWTVEDWTDFTIHKWGLNDKCEVTGILSIYDKRGGPSAAIWTNILVHQTNKLKYIFNQKTLIIIDSRRHISNILFEIVNKKLVLFNYLGPIFYIFGWVLICWLSPFFSNHREFSQTWGSWLAPDQWSDFPRQSYGVFHSHGGCPNSWRVYFMEYPTKMDDKWGYRHFRKPP